MKLINNLVVFLFISSFFLVTHTYGGEKRLLFHAGLGQRMALNEIKVVFEKRNPVLNSILNKPLFPDYQTS